MKDELKLFKVASASHVENSKEFDHLNYHYRARRDRPAMWKMALLAQDMLSLLKE